MTKLLFIFGGQKTGTSTMLSIINSSKWVFGLFEFSVNVKKRAAYCDMVEILNDDEQAKRIDSKAEQAKRIDSKAEQAKRIAERGEIYDESDGIIKIMEDVKDRVCKEKDYLYIADKIAGLKLDILEEIAQHKHIFTVRDIKTWPAKNSIRSAYKTEEDAAGPILDYTRCFISSFKSSPDMCLRVGLESLLGDKEKVIARVNDFLGVNVHPEWWKMAVVLKDNLKNPYRWWGGHRSATIEPTKLDTNTVLTKHDFWEQVLPIFNKYYSRMEESTFDSLEIEADLKKIEYLRSFGKIPLKELFEEIKDIEIVK